MRDRFEHDPEKVEAQLEQTRAELQAALAELRDRLTPEGLVSELMRKARSGLNIETAARSAGSSAKQLLGGATASALPLAKLAGSSIRANPVASAVAGAGLAWLAYSSFKARRDAPPEALPEWLVEAESLLERAEELRERIAQAKQAGAFADHEAEDSLADVERSYQQELRLVMGRGLDALDAETRAAALAARETAFDKRHGKGGDTGFKLGGVLSYGALIAAAGTALASVYPRQDKGETAEAKVQAAVDAAMAKARHVVEEQADRLSVLAETLAEALQDKARTDPSESNTAFTSRRSGDEG